MTEAAPAAIVSAATRVTVHHGQTLYAISRQENVPVRALIDANGLLPPYRLRAGEVLKVPSLHQHRVQPGETLYAVARRYGVEVSTLVRLNHLSPPYRIKTGQPIELPPPVAAESETTGNAGIWAPPQTIAAAPEAMPAASSQEAMIAPPPEGTPGPPPQEMAAPNPGNAANGDDGGPPTAPPSPGATSDMSASGPPPGNETSAAPVSSAGVEPGAVSSESLGAPPGPAATLPARASMPPPALTAHPPSRQVLTPPPVVVPEAREEPAPAPVVNVSAKIAAAVASHAAPISPIFDWPAQGKLLSLFGPGAGGTSNDGINILAPEGTTVTAAESGTVAYVGEMNGFGNLLLLKHGDGWISAYAHNEVLLVKKGQHVRRGQAIARVGATGGVSEPQLHFELRYGTRAVDPLDHLPPLALGAG